MGAKLLLGIGLSYERDQWSFGRARRAAGILSGTLWGGKRLTRDRGKKTPSSVEKINPHAIHADNFARREGGAMREVDDGRIQRSSRTVGTVRTQR